MNQPIELRKTRDFGQIINDSFTFLKENFKPLFLSLLIICGFFIVVGTVTSVFQYMGMMNLYRGAFPFNTNANAYSVPEYTVTYFVSLLFNAFVMIMLQVCIHMVTLCYISVYLQKGNTKPTFDEVWGYFKYYFFRVIGSGIVIAILIGVGFLLCVFPGIYVANVFYLVIPIIIIENTSFSYAFNRSFKLIKNNWWFVFGIIFITSLIVGIASSFAGIPLTILTVGSSFFSNKSFTLPLLIFFSALRNILMLAYALSAIAVALCYFNLSEEKEGLGLMERIDKFGKSNENDSSHPKEEY
jgi:hypothetical protein